MTTFGTPEARPVEPHPDLPAVKSASRLLLRALRAMPDGPGRAVGIRCAKDAVAAAETNAERAEALLTRARSYLP